MKKAILFLGCFIFLTVSVLQAQVLQVKEVIQEQNQWCWAAVSACVLDFYKNPVAQCEIADYTRQVSTWHNFGSVDCCVDASQGCNYWNYNWGTVGSIEDILVQFGEISNSGTSTLSKTAVQDNIDLQRPFIIRWGWLSGGGHFLVGHGLVDNQLYYMDPWYGEGSKVASYDWVVSGGNHNWTHTNVLSVSPPLTEGVEDIDGNHYATVIIGEQEWMVENLKTSRYHNGTAIDYPGTDVNAWENNTSGAYAFYENDESWKEHYGALYNWYAVNNDHGLCPAGWHVPEHDDWTQLIQYVMAEYGWTNEGDDPDGVGNNLKSCRQIDSPLGGLCNTTEHPRWVSSGAQHYGRDALSFSALPGGERLIDGTFHSLGGLGAWWSSSEHSPDNAYYRHMNFNFASVVSRIDEKRLGFSVRCVRIAEQYADLPFVTTAEVTDVEKTTALSGGTVVDDAGYQVTARGLVWDTTEEPTVSQHVGMSDEGQGTGAFFSTLTGLEPGTTYFVRAYATNENGTAYGSAQKFTTLSALIQPGEGVTDVDGNVYNSVIIGEQEWMAENLMTIRYRNGDAIQNITENADWGHPDRTTGAYSWPQNDYESWGNHYGAIYNWYAVNDERGLCPAGWRIPRYDDWEVLVETLGGNPYHIGLKLRSRRQVNSPFGGEYTTAEHPRWGTGSLYGTDDYGFAGLPAGYRGFLSGTFIGMDQTGEPSNAAQWWTATESGDRWWQSPEEHFDNPFAYWRGLQLEYPGLTDNNYGKTGGASVRCIKDIELANSKPFVLGSVIYQVFEKQFQCTGNVTYDGGLEVTDKGFYFGTSQNLQTEGTKVQLGSGEGVYIHDFTGLQAETTYYVQAYATNAMGASYGQMRSVTTPRANLPVVRTWPPRTMEDNGILLRGEVQHHGNAPITDRGFFWGNCPDPVENGTRLSLGSGSEMFTDTLTQLAEDVYYITAYATNMVGTSFGSTEVIALLKPQLEEFAGTWYMVEWSDRFSSEATFEAESTVDEDDETLLVYMPDQPYLDVFGLGDVPVRIAFNRINEYEWLPYIVEGFMGPYSQYNIFISGNSDYQSRLGLFPLSMHLGYEIRAYDSSTGNLLGYFDWGLWRFFKEPPVRIMVDIDPPSGGSVTGADVYPSGGMVQLNAYPHFGFRFVSWTENGEIISTDNELRFTATEDRLLKANFMPNNFQVDLFADPPSGGSVFSGGQYRYGTQITISAASNLYFDFVGWSHANNIFTSNHEFTFTVNNSYQLTAHFDAEEYVVTLEASQPEQGGVSGAGSYYRGEVVEVEATAQPGYHFLRWMLDGEQISVRNPYLFSALEDRHLVAEFAETWWDEKKDDPPYLITARVNPDFSGVVIGQGYYTEGEEVTLIASPNQGVEFEVWMEAGQVLLDDNDQPVGSVLTFIAGGNRELTAILGGETFEVNVDVNIPAYGTAEVLGEGPFFSGEFVRVLAESSPGNGFIKWTEDGQQISHFSNYGFTVSGDRSLTAHFDGLKHFDLTIEVQPENAGNVSGTTDGSYPADSEFLLKATENDGYTFEYWREGVEIISQHNEYNLVVYDHRDLIARFSRNFYPVHFNIANDYGDLNALADDQTFVSGDQLEHGSYLVFTATPDMNYQVAAWYINGIIAEGETDNVLVIEDLSESLEVSVEFELVSYTIIATSGEHGEIEPSGEVSVSHGSNQLFSIYPDSGYHIAELIVNNQGVDSADTYEFVEVVDNQSIHVAFAINEYTLTYEAGDYGSITGEATQTVEHGSDGTEVEAVPDEGYHFVAWSDGVNTARRTDANVTENLSVMANFSVNVYTIAASVNNETYGSVTGAGDYEHGETVTLTAASSDAVNYIFIEWTEDGTQVHNQPQYSFVATADRTLTANYQNVTSVVAWDQFSEVKVYPIPTVDILMVESETILEQVRLLDLVGKVHMSEKVNKMNYALNVSHLREGMYILIVVTPDGLSTHRVQIVR